MTTSPQQTKPERSLLGVRVTPEQRNLIAHAAKREQRSVSSFVLQAALKAAATEKPARRRTREEIRAIVEAAREEVRAANPTGGSLVDALIAERRRESASE
jgi:hypothetical protein